VKIPTNDVEGIASLLGVVALVGVISAFAMTKLARRAFPKPREDMLFSRQQFIATGVCFAIALALWMVT
jgi:hypothetical protein